ncbi:ATP-binding protein [Kitasatospora sp. NPDC058965]|uniref:ATP-binding protein n=1 Tax=Kitasatospora sp. NPDC058965 TaxID=3346682 RepID=UPI00369178BE
MTLLHTTRGLGTTADLAAVGSPAPTPSALHSELPDTHKAAGTARAKLNQLLRGRLTPDSQGTASLILTELVANAVTASGGSGSIWVEIQLTADELLLEVFDRSPGIPCRRMACDLAEDGRGLLLVEELSIHWGWRPEPGGKVVWAIVKAEAAKTPGANQPGTEGAVRAVSAA